VTDDNIEVMAPQQAKSFLSVLAEQGNGHVVSEMSRELHALIESIEQHYERFRGKVAGSLALTMKFTLENGKPLWETELGKGGAPGGPGVRWETRRFRRLGRLATGPCAGRLPAADPNQG
jgi:hypothetical protein